MVELKRLNTVYQQTLLKLMPAFGKLLANPILNRYKLNDSTYLIDALMNYEH